jgi:signal transduction histidine kinase
MMHGLVNLVSNAIDACSTADPGKKPPAKDPRILVQTLPARGWGVEYRVADNGCGMTAEVRDKIFTRFFSTKGTGGTGIGLMMTRNIVERHGGVIHADSGVGKGSTFVIRLPAKMDCR